MEINQNTKLPKFFNYKGDGGTDNGYESMQDFFLSWTFRCAMDEFEKINPAIHQYSKLMLYRLTRIQQNNPTPMPLDFEIKSVNTKRQWKQIDLLVELIVNEGGIKKEYLLNIENKWYTNFTKTQLQKSKDHVIKKYGSSSFTILDIGLCADYYDPNNRKQICSDNGYHYITIEDLKDFAGIDKLDKETWTKNALFDEYWFG